MNQLAVVFVGQGSQYPMMSLDFIEKQQDLKTIELVADHILPFSVREVLNANDERIHDTFYTQPLLIFASIVAYEALLKEEPLITAVAGFSLGEYAAYYASNVLDIDDTFKLILKRAEAMQKAQVQFPGKMAAILGLQVEEVESICKNFNTTDLVIANYNAPNQVVLSGKTQAVEDAVNMCKEKGARRAVILQVSGAFHSPLMTDAAKALKEYITNVEVKVPSKDLYLNTTGNRFYKENLKDVMEQQVKSSVRFIEMIQNMKKNGITHILEVGPGKVLSGLVKKIDQTLEIENLENTDDLIRVKGWLLNNGFKQ